MGDSSSVSKTNDILKNNLLYLSMSKNDINPLCFKFTIVYKEVTLSANISRTTYGIFTFHQNDAQIRFFFHTWKLTCWLRSFLLNNFQPSSVQGPPKSQLTCYALIPSMCLSVTPVTCPPASRDFQSPRNSSQHATRSASAPGYLFDTPNADPAPYGTLCIPGRGTTFTVSVYGHKICRGRLGSATRAAPEALVTCDNLPASIEINYVIDGLVLASRRDHHDGGEEDQEHNESLKHCLLEEIPTHCRIYHKTCKEISSKMRHPFNSSDIDSFNPLFYSFVTWDISKAMTSWCHRTSNCLKN